MKSLYKIITSAALLILTSCDLSYSGGVTLQNELPPSVHLYVKNNQILDSNESIVAYYDATITLSNEVSAIITNKSLIYHNNGVNTKMRLSDIVSIDHKKETFIGDVITVESYDGNLMKIEIAPLNDGELFLQILKDRTDYF
tara:strand:- start:3095 stop:3520 length:426 start_codon:yes stop_codon:yes gene_type:complete